MLRDLRHTVHFLFTQHSLATFDNCPLKFKKRYLEGLKWDSFPDEAIKKRIDLGNSFHLLAHRYFMGIEPGLDESDEDFEVLNKWLMSLQEKFPLDKETIYLPEYKLRMISPEIKLEANFDLLLIKDGKVEIWDWKTHSGFVKTKKDTSAQRLVESLQTKVYLFVLKEKSDFVLGRNIDCEQISMNYWQPYPKRLIARVEYNQKLHDVNRSLLEGKEREILQYDYSCFDKSLYSKHCRMCEFNWFCNNERIDFNAIEEDDALIESLDWDSIEERY